MRGAGFSVLRQINTRPFSEVDDILFRRLPDMQLTGQQLVKTYRSMRTIWEFEERVHEEFATGQILGFVHPYASMHRSHRHSIEEGAES
jgi:hypothetical protein